ncbi:MAG: NAD(P)/FAD-dependent oxidoreductase [Methanomassiliicoccales archaeon]|nr:NAD(P)/FAD-dependent oxidoreductase [Methanomassiliicoccales archaeon]
MRAVVIGAGVVGALIARELCRYDLTVLLFERELEVGFGVTKANSAIVHAGFHDEPGTLRARFCVKGNAFYPKLCEELGVPFRRTGAYVLALHAQEVPELERLLAQGEKNGVPGLEIQRTEEILAREPKVNPKIVAGLWAPTVGVTEPWALAQAAVENALLNGLELHLAEKVQTIEVKNGCVKGIKTDVGFYAAEIVVNAAGLFADQVARMAGLDVPEIRPRRGQYILLEGETNIHSVLFPCPTPKSKGILVVPSVDGNLLLGPTAEDVDDKADTTTTQEGLQQVREGAKRLVPDLDFSRAIKSFAGLRPETAAADFWVGPTKIRGFYQAGAMRSPGLTAAPAIARFLVHEVIATEWHLSPRNWNPRRVPPPRVADLSPEEWDELIRQDPRFGRIVCFCNLVTEGEVVEAIRRGARTIDGIKLRTRAGFGRCQGGFCTDKLLLILARELGKGAEDIKLKSERSPIVIGPVRP